MKKKRLQLQEVKTETYNEMMDAIVLQKFNHFLELLSPYEVNTLWNLYQGTFLRNSIIQKRLGEELD